MEQRPPVRRIGFFIIGAVALIAFLFMLWNYFSTGKIIITTDNPNNTITLKKITEGDDKGQQSVLSAHNKLSIKTKTGRYIVLVEGNSVATSKQINLTAHKTMQYEINPINATGVEPVLYRDVQNVAVDSNKLAFADGTTGSLFTIDGVNNLATIASTVAFQTVKWVNPSLGLGQDNNGRLYVINNGIVSPLKVPFVYGSKSINFDIFSATQVYLSFGADIYYGNLNGSFKRIYSATSNFPVLAAGTGGRLAVANPSVKQANPVPPMLATIDASGAIIKKELNSGVLSWSPDGQYLLSVDEQGADLYDNNLKQVDAIATPDSSVGQAIWLDNSRIIYSTNDQLWIYDIVTREAQNIANMPQAASITEISTSQDKSYIYLVVQNDANAKSLKRVGLKGQTTPDYVFNLQSIMPLSLDNYSMSLINFGASNTPPAILVRPFSSTASSSLYLQAAKTELQQRGFNINQLQFKLESSSGD
jgi:hypothetical protein